MSLDTPVALFLFNRPLETARVFARIADVRPAKLLLVADGPRNHGEHETCQAARSIIAEIDWPCDVIRNYSDVNLGCRRRISSGISWVFSQVENAILLEDDCLPEPSFFPYCRQMLQYYQDEERVMTISGDNFQLGVRHTPYSYYFSGLHHTWGWATWRRAWKHYDVDLKQWPFVADSAFPGDLVPPEAAARHRKLIAGTYDGKINAWEHPWTFACWMRRALCVVPAVNLVSNIGFGPSATHCKKADAFAALPTEPMAFPLRHPPRIDLCSKADEAFLMRSHRAA
jgi:hypothetical protein